MWFKQITFYPINNANALPEIDTLANKLATLPFQPVMGLDWFSEGFSAPQTFSPELVFPADLTWSVALKKSEKVLPASVIREVLNERISEISEQEGRTLSRKEKQILKENIIDELLPRAFTRSHQIHAVCDLRHNFLMVNTANTNKSENLISKMREALGGLDVRLPHTKHSPIELMTRWLSRGQCSGDFELDDFCELKGTGDAAPVIKINKQDLTAEEVVQHLKNGKVVTQLGLIWREQIAFVLAENFTLKRIEYLDIIQEQTEQHGDDPTSLAYASQIIGTEAVSLLISELVKHLGDWVD